MFILYIIHHIHFPPTSNLSTWHFSGIHLLILMWCNVFWSSPHSLKEKNLLNFNLFHSLFVLTAVCLSTVVKGASGGLQSILNLQWMSWIGRSPLRLVCPAQHVSATVLDLHMHIITNMHTQSYLSLCFWLFRRANTVFSQFLPIDSLNLQHTNETVWAAVSGLFVSPTSMTPGPMPSTPNPLQPLSIQGLL